MKRTPAEEQMEELRRLRESMGKRKPTPLPKAPSPTAPRGSATTPPGPTTSMGAYELVEPVAKRKKEDPSLALSKELYRQLMER